MGETSSVREVVLDLIPPDQLGIDIGFGGDKIRDDFIGLDRASENYCVDLVHDLKSGPIPIEDSKFDVVYCCHLLEKFEDPEFILKEMARICRPAGRMILVFPDQRKYEENCKRLGTAPDPANKIPDLSLSWMIKKVDSLDLIGPPQIFATFIKPYNCILAFALKKAVKFNKTEKGNKK